jgi:hypothetical protein
MALHFSRDTKVFCKQGSNVWELPVLDGFSFSQATNASEITLNEMESSSGSRRARQMFNDSYAPAEWSFSTYARPNYGTVAEEALWANFIAANSYSGSWSAGVTVSGGTTTFDFDDSNKAALGTFDLFFVMGAVSDTDNNYDGSAAGAGVSIYKLEGCVANEVSVDFDIDGISTLNWSGFGKIITEEDTFNASGAIDRAITSTSNFIRNRLTTLDVSSSISGSSVTYALTLTGGNITFANNITFLTPETLGIVNQPLGHVTGTRSISGNFTCYLDTAANKSRELFEHVIEATTTVTNSFDMAFNIGGGTAPKLVVDIPTAHLEVPTHSIDDVISIEANFHALPSTIDGTDEATVAYTGVQSGSTPTVTNTLSYSTISDAAVPGDLTVTVATTNANGETVYLNLVSGDGNVKRYYATTALSNSASFTIDEVDMVALADGGATAEDGFISVTSVVTTTTAGQASDTDTIEVDEVAD